MKNLLVSMELMNLNIIVIKEYIKKNIRPGDLDISYYELNNKGLSEFKQLKIDVKANEKSLIFLIEKRE